MQMNHQKAEIYFRLVSERYGHGSIILTSNKYFSLDRLLHHAHVTNIRGQTYRLKD